MSLKFSNSLTAIAGCILVMSAQTTWASTPELTPPGTSANDGQNVEQRFQGFNLQGYDESGEKTWDVRGDTAQINGADVELKNVNANTYGSQTVNVTAETGHINQVSGEMRLEKDVVITSEDGQQLFTDSLDWNRSEDVVTTEDDVTIADKQFTATGKGMKAQPGLKNAKIHEDVTVFVETEPEDTTGDTVTITSDGPMVIDQLQQLATFEINVVAVQMDRTLKADRMEIYFNEEMNDIKKLVCIGNVTMIQGDNKSYAQKAIYTAEDQRLVLSGRPKLIMQTEGDLFATSGD